MRSTCPKSERLLIDQKIFSLAEDLLSQRTIDFANELSNKIVDGRYEKIKAIRILTRIIPTRPKRPLYYARQKMRYLPHWTRDPIRYLGDYIDYLERKALKKFMINSYRKGWSPSAIRTKLRPFIPYSLYLYLEKYDKLFWTPAKHDFKVDESIRKHRFTTKEVVYCVFITIKLSCFIKKSAGIRVDPDPNTYFGNGGTGDYVIEPD